jgi:type II secretory pathway component PulK
MTLWALVLLSVLAMNFTFATRRGSASTRNFKDETRAYYRAVSAYEEALDYLFSDKDLSVDFMDAEGRFWTDIDRETIAGKRDVEDANVTVKITDEESRFNINLLTPPMLRRLFIYAGIPEDEIDGLVDSLSDWKDPDDLHRLNGTESDYYEGLETPYKAKNAFLDTMDELLLVKGFKPEYLYGGEDTKPIADMLTVYGAGLNVNTASSEVFEMLGIDPLDIDTAMKSRTADAGGLRAIPQAFTGAGVGLTQSQNFRVEVYAEAKGGGPPVKITSIVRRLVGPDGIKLKTVYWREGV